MAGWLREHADAFREDLDGTPEVRQFPGGASNLTYLLRYPGRDLDPAPAARGREGEERPRHGPRVRHPASARAGLPLRRADGRAVRRRVGDRLRLLRDGAASTAPSSARSCRSSSRPHEASDAVRARLGGAGPTALRRRVRRTELAALGRGDGYVARQVAGWTDRLSRAATDDLGDWSGVTAWLDAHQPADVGQCLIHNDWRFDNMVLDPVDRLRVHGVLDWEMATVGDPLMDLGGALAYWIQADDDDFFQAFRRQPTTAPGMWTPRAGRGLVRRADRARGDAGAVALLRGVRPVPARRDLPADLVPLLPRPDPQRGLRPLRPGGRLPGVALPGAGLDRLDEGEA